MAARTTILICSDIHYASDEEKRRVNYEAEACGAGFKRWLIGMYRRYIWLRDPFAHNHLLKQVLDPPAEPDWVVANGDYSCDSAFIGVADPCALSSAQICLGKLRERFPDRFFATFGDHELGKVSLAGGRGGLRLDSYHAAREKLNLQPFWSQEVGRYVLVGVTSTLVAMPVYEREALEEEKSRWREIAAEHCAEIRRLFEWIPSNRKVLLFCHDPTALPFLREMEAVRKRLPQIERTIIGHLHSPLFLLQSRILKGMPRITGCGPAIRRMSSALNRARHWKPFNVLLCPSLPGIQLLKDGGYFLARIDPDAVEPARFDFQKISWKH